MSFTVRQDLKNQPPELRKYLQSLEVTSLMNKHEANTVQAIRMKVTDHGAEYWCIGPIDKKPLYALIEVSSRSDRLHDYAPVRL